MRFGRFGLALLVAAWTIVVGAFLWGPRDAVAGGSQGWTITSFHSDIAVANNSKLTIQEDIQVDFASLQKHGIFRTIPTRYRYDSTHDRYYDLAVISVTDGTRPVTYTTSVDNYNQVIKIGDPNFLVSGKQRYVITYTVVGAMNSFSDHNELFWNVDGALWPVAKGSVTATVHLPAAIIQKAACYEGPAGSTETCAHTYTGPSATFASTRALDAGEQMSVVVAVDKVVVAVPPPMLEPRLRQFPQDAFDINPVTILVSLLVLVAGIGFVAWNWWVHGRDREYLSQYYLTNESPTNSEADAVSSRGPLNPRQGPEPLFRHEPVVVEFGPPQDLRPAELGLILDEKADAKDVTATIVDLAVRGYLTIAEIPGKEDWVLTQMKGWDPAELMPFENTILSGLFASRQQVTISDLKGTFTIELAAAESQMYKDAMTRKWFASNPKVAQAGWGCLGIGILSAGIAAAIFLGIQFGWGLLGVAVIIVGLVMTASFPFMAQRTAAGRDVLQHTLGFRLYMTTAEKYRQQFAAKADIFTQLLPYAIVFGAVTLWAKAFEGIDTSVGNNWYVGAGPFQAAALAGSLQSMNAGISSAIAFNPSSGSSSGFGGGGFSGGGGGGGGGGAW